MGPFRTELRRLPYHFFSSFLFFFFLFSLSLFRKRLIYPLNVLLGMPTSPSEGDNGRFQRADVGRGGPRRQMDRKAGRMALRGAQPGCFPAMRRDVAGLAESNKAGTGILVEGILLERSFLQFRETVPELSRSEARAPGAANWGHLRRSILRGRRITWPPPRLRL